MITVLVLVASLCLGPFPSAALGQQPSPPARKAVGSITWTDPAKDIEPISTSKGQVPGFDLVKLAVASDGTALSITATLAAPPTGVFASDVARLLIDTDNNPATGYATFRTNKAGFELKAALNLCIEYDSGSACAGAMSNAKVKQHYASLEVGKIIDTSMNVEAVFPPFKEPRGTVTGPVVTASVPYKDLGLKSGQTIRILAEESCAQSENREFPVALLTLK